MKTALTIIIAAVTAFTLGVKYERTTHDELHRAFECPTGTWKYSWCVPTGCSVDLATFPPNWDCGSRSFQQVTP